MEIVLEAEHTHFYPGHEGAVAGGAPILSRKGERWPSRIVFADGAMAGGMLKCTDDGRWDLEVSPYTTAAGTDIAAKRWQLSFRRHADGRTRFRIERKLAARSD
jgi:hypothetical protein